MRIKSKKAANLFFPNTSLEFVYYEAIANSIDAQATDIAIEIEIESFNDPDTLKITIQDNGVGFNDRNFNKFNHVLDVEDDQHKGVGRLVFLNYFDQISVDSTFENKNRKFIFNEDFDGESELTNASGESNSTKIEFLKYKKEKIKTYDYLVPNKVNRSILEHFLPKFYQMKLENKELIINVTLKTKTPNNLFDFKTSAESIDIQKLPELKERRIDDKTSLFSYFKLLYSVEKTVEKQSVITAICADGRTMKMEIISNKEFPIGYKMIFILYSDYFDGKANNAREGLHLDDQILKHAKKMFTRMVSQVIREEIPNINIENSKIQEKLQNQYPHLVGYFNIDSIGLVEKANIVSEAQENFFNDQKDILEASELSDDQYEKSLIFSSRILTEYILYRTKIIHKLKSMDVKNHESEIHDLIVPRKQAFYKNSNISDVFANNAWVLDDKYMSYSKVLSDSEIEQIYEELNIQGSHQFNEEEKGRPDITIVFSDDPMTEEKVDVVIIEFKKLGLKLAKKEDVVSQLRQRARRLIEFYPQKIQRIWFYGIIDFDPEFRVSLIENGFTQLFSKGELFYKPQDIIVNPDTLDKKRADLFILSYNAMIDDAESRNATFLKILKEGLKENSNTIIAST